ncbi:MAG: hypothetical protein KC910_07755 [Candidatus Eremiobacteraeota bacterium]|nr:hypothetical protein [Candidatus Eremiobacteraeota bacterium]
MRYRVLLLWWLLCAVAWAQNWQALEERSFKISVPEHWKVGKDALGFFQAAPVLDQPPWVKVVSATAPEGFDLDAYVERSQSAWRKVWKVEKVEKAEVADCEARKVLLNQKLPNGQVTRQLKVFLSGKGQTYVISFASPPSRFEALQGVFGQILDSFEPVAPELNDKEFTKLTHELLELIIKQLKLDPDDVSHQVRMEVKQRARRLRVSYGTGEWARRDRYRKADTAAELFDEATFWARYGDDAEEKDKAAQAWSELKVLLSQPAPHRPPDPPDE